MEVMSQFGFFFFFFGETTTYKEVQLLKLSMGILGKNLLADRSTQFAIIYQCIVFTNQDAEHHIT